MQTVKLSTAIWTRMFQICEREEQSNKIFCSERGLRAELLSSELTDVELQHLFFDSAEELSQQGNFREFISFKRRALQKSVFSLDFILAV